MENPMVEEWLSNFLDMLNEVELEGEDRKIFMEQLAYHVSNQSTE